ncbi:MAG TPA: hypothetical protein VFJ62_15995 [Usitatibacter sp.]|nr:hypothetical protein [Usitatibacter sp.]
MKKTYRLAAAAAAMIAAMHAVAQAPASQLDATRARQVRSILDAAQARMIAARAQIGEPTTDAARVALLDAIRTIRFEADTQLATVLTQEEYARFKEASLQTGWQRAWSQRGTPM